MTPKLEVLNPENHRSLIYSPQEFYRFFTHRLTAPLLFSEFVEASRSYPIIFSLSEGDDKLVPMALLGFDPVGGNQYVTPQGTWRAGHVIPASLRNYPFFAGPMDEQGEITLLVDVHAPHFQSRSSRPSDSPLFSPSGEPSAVLASVRKRLLEYQKRVGQTDWLVYKLYELNIFHITTLSELFPDREVASLNRFFVLDREKFENLSDDYFLALRQQGMMEGIYALMASQNRVSTLINELGEPHENPLTLEKEKDFFSFEHSDASSHRASKNRRLWGLAAIWMGIALLSGLLIRYLVTEPHTEDVSSYQTPQPYYPTESLPERPVLEKSEVEPWSNPVKERHGFGKDDAVEKKSPSVSVPMVESLGQPPSQQGMDKAGGEWVVNSSKGIPSRPGLGKLENTVETTHDYSSRFSTVLDEESASLRASADSLSGKREVESTPTTVARKREESIPLPSLVPLIQTSEEIAQEMPIEREPLHGVPPKRRSIIALQEVTPVGSAESTAVGTGPQEQGKEEQLNALVDGAKRNVSEARLSLPKGDNALEKIARIKAIAPESPAVDDLLNAVFERFLELAIWDRQGRSKLYLEKARQLFPGDPRIEEIEALIAAAP